MLLSHYELPARRETIRQAVKIAGHTLYLDVGLYPHRKRERVGEVFIVVRRTGEHERALLDTIARMISLGLQHHVPLARYVTMLVGTRFAPAGPVVGDARIKFCTSPLDYVGRYLGVYFCGRDDLAHGPGP